MSNTVEATIEALRTRLGAATDAELARLLGIDKSTVSSWRARGSVPARFLELLSGNAVHYRHLNTAASKWTDQDRASFDLALFRFARVMAGEAEIANYRAAIEAFSSLSIEFWELLAQADADLTAILSQGERHPQTALHLAMYDDLEAGDEALARDRHIIKAPGL